MFFGIKKGFNLYNCIVVDTQGAYGVYTVWLVIFQVRMSENIWLLREHRLVDADTVIVVPDDYRTYTQW